ncbi:MAG: hypothetical protein HGB32_16275 [Geobacteraceae bacterium]|nr:hypothetical protein [Geobacteraceae bacterium]
MDDGRYREFGFSEPVSVFYLPLRELKRSNGDHVRYLSLFPRGARNGISKGFRKRVSMRGLRNLRRSCCSMASTKSAMSRSG